MAYSLELWEKAKGYYEAGLSLSKINDKTGIDRSAISRKAKKQQWQHGCNIDYIKAREIIASKKATESQQVLQCADEVADDIIRRANLVYGASEKLVKRASEVIEKNITVDRIIKDGSQEFGYRELNTSDLKNLSDTIDKASITLGVNQRHANSQVQINNTNAQQNNKELTLSDFYNETQPNS